MEFAASPSKTRQSDRINDGRHKKSSSWRERNPRTITLLEFSLPPPGRPSTPAQCPTTSTAGKTALARRRSRGSIDQHEPGWAERARRTWPPQEWRHHHGGCSSPQSTSRRSFRRSLQHCQKTALPPPTKRAATTVWRTPRRLLHRLSLPDRSSSDGREGERWGRLRGPVAGGRPPSFVSPR
jgi:hypothetical protein